MSSAFDRAVGSVLRPVAFGVLAVALSACPTDDGEGEDEQASTDESETEESDATDATDTTDTTDGADSSSETTNGETSGWMDCAEAADQASCDVLGELCEWLPGLLISHDGMTCSVESSGGGACLPTPGEDSCVGEDGDSCGEGSTVHAWTRSVAPDQWEVIYADYSATDVCAGPGGGWDYCFGFGDDPAGCTCLCEFI